MVPMVVIGTVDWVVAGVCTFPSQPRLYQLWNHVLRWSVTRNLVPRQIRSCQTEIGSQNFKIANFGPPGVRSN